MTINHSIPHQQLLPNVTLLLIKIHPAARHWGTNELEIGCRFLGLPTRCSQLLQERKFAVGREAGKWDTLSYVCARPPEGRGVSNSGDDPFPGRETEALGAKYEEINPKSVWILRWAPSS